jgi:hypothetical protein
MHLYSYHVPQNVLLKFKAMYYPKTDFKKNYNKYIILVVCGHRNVGSWAKESCLLSIVKIVLEGRDGESTTCSTR